MHSTVGAALDAEEGVAALTFAKLLCNIGVRHYDHYGERGMEATAPKIPRTVMARLQLTSPSERPSSHAKEPNGQR